MIFALALTATLALSAAYLLPQWVAWRDTLLTTCLRCGREAEIPVGEETCDECR